MASRKRRGEVCCCVILLILLSAVSAFGYVLLGVDWAHQDDPVEEEWHICLNGFPAEAAERIKTAAATWTSVAFHYRFGEDACLSNGVFPLANNVMQIDFGDLGGPTGPLAQLQYVAAASTGNISECDLRFNSAIPWHTGAEPPPPGQYDLQSFALHEFGHCLGLDHETGITNPLPVMFPALGPGIAQRELTADDIAGRDVIYGTEPPPTGSRPDLTGTWQTLSQSCRMRRSGLKCKLTGSLLVQNQGNKMAPSASVQFYQSDDTALDGGDVLLRSLTTRPLMAGKARNLRFTASLSVGSSASGTQIIAVLDAGDGVVESDEGNNIAVSGPVQ